MTYEEKKEWLRRYRKAAKLEKIKLEEVERYRTDAEHITQMLSPVPGGAGDGQALPRSVERITDAMQAANAQVMECQRICKEILSVMNQTVDIQDYEILYLMINTLFLIAFAYSYSSTGNPDCQCSFVSLLLITAPLFPPVSKRNMPEV